MLSVAVAIDELECTLPAWLLKKLKPSNYPAYVHVLRVSTVTMPYFLFQPDKDCKLIGAR